MSVLSIPPPTSLSDKNSRVRTALKFPREARVSKRALIYVANGDVFAPRGHVITDCLRRRCVWASEYFSVSVRGEPKLRQQYENTIQQSIIAKYTVWEASGGFCFCFVSQLRKRLISGGGSKIRVARRLKYGKQQQSDKSFFFPPKVRRHHCIKRMLTVCFAST